MLKSNKLSLGTAKLGMSEYGHSDGIILLNPINFIKRSLDFGIRFIDTSPGYGNSEEIIGKALKRSDIKHLISTKIDNLAPNTTKTPELMLKSINKSIHNLNSNIDICYLHQNAIEIISDKYIHEGIELLKNSNLIKEVGASVYTKEELIYTLECGIFDWVQIPVNILDTSFYHMVNKYDSQIKVAARSVFLQGAILNDKWARSKINQHSELIKTLNQLKKLCLSSDITISQLSVAYLSSLKRINQIIIGTISGDKIRENICSTKIQLDEKLINSVDRISEISKPWSNPRNWQL